MFTFQGFDNPLSKCCIIFYKNFLYAMARLGYAPKLKKGLGSGSGVYFLHDIPIKIFI